MEQNNFSYAKRKVIAIPVILFVITMLSVFVSACQLNVSSGTTTLPNGNYQYDCVYVAPGATLACGGNSLNITAITNITIKGTLDCDAIVSGGPSPGGAASSQTAAGGGAGHIGAGGQGGIGVSGGGQGAGGGSLGNPLDFLQYTGSSGGVGNGNVFCSAGGGGVGGSQVKLRAPLIDISSATNINVAGGTGGKAHMSCSCTSGAGNGGGGSGGSLMFRK